MKTLIELWDKRNQDELSWFRSALSVVAIIIGLIVSFKSTESKNEIENILFIVAILLNALCLLCGLLFLYRDVSTSDLLVKGHVKHMLHDLSSDSKETSSIVSPKPFYEILRRAFFVLLFLSILSSLIFGTYQSLF